MLPAAPGSTVSCCSRRLVNNCWWIQIRLWIRIRSEYVDPNPESVLNFNFDQGPHLNCKRPYCPNCHNWVFIKYIDFKKKLFFFVVVQIRLWKKPRSTSGLNTRIRILSRFLITMSIRVWIWIWIWSGLNIRIQTHLRISLETTFSFNFYCTNHNWVFIIYDAF